jgi:hypothetical protein
MEIIKYSSSMKFHNKNGEEVMKKYYCEDPLCLGRVDGKGERCEDCKEEQDKNQFICTVCDGSGFSVSSIGHPCGTCEGTGEVFEGE